MNYLTTENGTPEPINLRSWIKTKAKATGASYPEFWNMTDSQVRNRRLKALGVYPYTVKPKPEVTGMQKLEAGPIQQVDGVWVQDWVVVDATAQEVRSKRNRLLSASDWTQLSDSPVDQSAWATYRQALRDIPKQAGFPTNVTWPTEPS